MKPAPLKLVIERYRRLRDDAAAAQARVQMERETALRTLKTLEQYRDEQHERARASQQQVHTPPADNAPPRPGRLPSRRCSAVATRLALGTWRRQEPAARK